MLMQCQFRLYLFIVLKLSFIRVKIILRYTDDVSVIFRCCPNDSDPLLIGFPKGSRPTWIRKYVNA